jgi:putative hydrolase of the HAD superfamily
MTASTATLESGRAGGRRDGFADVDTWVFDLDDTLYPRSIGLHDQMKRRVVLFIADHMKIDHAAAEAVHLDYYQRYGATLHGLIDLHGIAPRAFLDFIHDIDLSVLGRNEDLIIALRALPGRRIVFTNASRGHAVAALEAMGMSDLFDAIASIEDSDFLGKPHLRAFSGFLDAHGINPRTAAMFEDRPGNLVVPHELGMKTVLVIDPSIDAIETLSRPPHVDVVVADLTAFLASRKFAGRSLQSPA